jgi:hypothetical protein
MNIPVSFPIVKLLKEKNYEDEDCENVYLGDFDEEFPPQEMEVSTRNLRQRNLGEFDCLAPTISEVVMWLYEKHGIWVSCDATVNLWFYSISTPETGKMLVSTSVNHFNSPTEAYEAAIEYCLTKLI